MARAFLKYTILFLFFVYANLLVGQNSTSYKELIISADKYFEQKEYYNAKTTYQLALQLDENAEYPKNRIKEIIQLLNDEMEIRILYEEKIGAAEEAYANKDYDKAISLYEEASALISYEDKPKQELIRIKKERADLIEKQKQIENFLAQAQKDKAAEKFASAIENLEGANKLAPESSEILKELAQVKLLLKQQIERKKQFDQLVANADKQFEINQFQFALDNYLAASKLFENEAYVNAQIPRVKEAIKTEAAYNKVIEQADAFYVALDIEQAKKAYEEARKIWPEKTYPSNMLAKMDEANQRRTASLNEINKEYKSKIDLADQQFDKQNFEQAYDLYIKALNLKPTEEYPQNQIQKINKLLAKGSLDLLCKVNDNGQALAQVFVEIAEQGKTERIDFSKLGSHQLKLKLNSRYTLKFKKEKYVQKIVELDTRMPDNADLNRDYSFEISIELFPLCSLDVTLLENSVAAISFQESANKFTMDLARFNAINKQVAELKRACEQKLAEEQKLAKYNELLSKADVLVKTKEYKSAIDIYQNAQSLYPEKTFAIGKITELEALVKQENEFTDLVVNGDAKFAKGQFNDALFDYYKAKNIKPDAAHVLDRIAEIDKILVAQDNEEKLYQMDVLKADSLFGAKLWKEAIGFYEKALALKKNEAYPKKQLAEANQFLLAENELIAAYTKAIKEADTYFENKMFPEARKAYLAANKIKPDEQYPLYKIEDINTIVEQKDIRETNTRYNSLITSADKLYNEKVYPLSLSQYKQASVLKPTELYPKKQIEKISQILDAQKKTDNQYAVYVKSADSAFYLDEWTFARALYLKAKELKPSENYPPEQINKIDLLLSDLVALETNYNNAIRRADESFAQSEYGKAKADYLIALNFKPNEAYPKTKIEEIDRLLAELSDMELAYQDAILNGDQNFEAKQYPEAINHYKKALEIKPDAEYPKDQLVRIEDILAQLDQLENKYKDVLAKADNYFSYKQYGSALFLYKEAKALKPAEEYPPQQIAIINHMLATQKRSNKYDQLVASADSLFLLKKYNPAKEKYVEAIDIMPYEEYPKSKIAEIDALLAQLSQLDLKKAAYNKAIENADKLYAKRSYVEALPFYKEANQLIPEESYPPEQIAKIKDMLGANDKAYNAYIQQGDEAYKYVMFQEAIVAFENALAIYPNEAYPKMMLEKIDARLKRESVVNVFFGSEIIKDGTERKYTFVPIEYKDRQNNYILIELKNPSEEPIRVFINFGEDGMKNGGYVVNLIKRPGYMKYFVRIDRQLRWINKDNNWISLLPEGGDLDVNLVQISKDEQKN